MLLSLVVLFVLVLMQFIDHLHQMAGERVRNAESQFHTSANEFISSWVELRDLHLRRS